MLDSTEAVPLESTLPLKNQQVRLRVATRYVSSPGTRGRLHVAEEKRALRAWVRDISSQGIGLLLARKLEPGTPLIVQIDGKADGALSGLEARVVHATAQAAGEWLVGCALVRGLSAEELQDLL